MKKTAQTTIVLNALALAGMLVFASQAANAASIDTETPTHKSQTITHESSLDATNVSSNDVSSSDVDTHDVDTNDVDTNDVDHSGDIGDIGNQDFDATDATDAADAADIPDAGESN